MTTIEVFADVTCPFTHVGLRRFVAERAKRDRADVRLWVRAWPLEVVNGKPHDPHFFAEEVEDIREQVAADLFVGFSEAAFPVTSLPALRLAGAAYDVDLTTGEDMSLALRDLLFERGVDIGDGEVVRQLAADHHLDVDLDDHQRVLDDHAEGVERGVQGSPHFFTPDGGFFCPGLDIHRDAAGHLHIDPAEAGFHAFLTSCFG